MKITKVTIHNFKSIRNDFVLDIDKRITALVGASESGKTNVLKALERFNRGAQYKQEDFCTFCGAEPAPDSQMVSIVFAVTRHERERLDSLGLQLVGKEEIAITKCFGGQYLLDVHPYPPAPSPDTPHEIQNFLADTLHIVVDLIETLNQVYGQRDELSPLLESAREALDQLRTNLSQSDQFTPLRRSEGVDPFAELLNKWQSVQDSLGQLPEQTPEIEATTAHLSRQIEAAPETLARLLELPTVAIDILDLVPGMVYLHDRDVEFLEDSVAIGELEASPEKHKTMMNLLALGKLTVEHLRTSEAPRRRRILRNAGERVSRVLNLAWMQEGISLEFDVSAERLHVNIGGKEGHYGPLSDRSEGFRWFLSFYANFVASSSRIQNTVLLLDEPGIHLHASGQKDLLTGFEEIGESTQVIYTTHSAYMINKNFPQRIRAVLKGDRDQGTYVENKAYRPTKGGPYEPIRSAIGLSLGNSLFLGMKNLIVEGISDHILLAAVSRRFATEGEEPLLDLQEVCITPAGGAQNVPYLAYLASHEGMKTIVLLDSDTEGDKAANRIEKEGVLSKENVIRIGDITTARKGEILKTLEDLFDREFYCRAIEAAYKEVKGPTFVLPKPGEVSNKGEMGGGGGEEGTNENLPEPTPSSQSGKPRTYSNKEGIVKQYIRLFEEDKELGDFDKVLVAKKVAEMLDDGQLLSDESAKRFRKLFELITQKLV